MRIHARPAPLVAALVLLACSSKDPPGSCLAQGDAAVLQQVLDGALPAGDGLMKVARSGGWPIAACEGYVFAVADGGLGPYQLASPTAAFPGVALASKAGVAWAVAPRPPADAAPYHFVTRFGDAFADPLARRFAYSGGQEVSLVDARGAHLERWPSIGDATIPARTLRVWVPSQPPTHFLYAHDGQNLFDPSGPWGSWRLQDAAGPRTLVVGIDNGPARIDEYTHVQDTIGDQLVGGRGGAYADFVELTVRPFIEARYGKPARVGVIGASLGGLVSYEQELRHPGRYDFVASMSGTFGWGSIGPGMHAQTLIEAYAARGSCPAATFYLDSGGGPGSGCVDADGDGIRDDTPDAGDSYCENEQMAEALRAIACGARLTRRWADGAQHNEAAWRARAPAALAIFEAL